VIRLTIAIIVDAVVAGTAAMSPFCVVRSGVNAAWISKIQPAIAIVIQLIFAL
tara:strand:+ start:2544 stop:2702 length:159 start_codon:yes stop_codon:yes gene_type:complete